MEIYGIITQHGIEHTRNKNGVFVNMSTLPNDVVHTIHQFVSFCHDNKIVLDEYDKRLNECKFLCARHDEASHQKHQQPQPQPQPQPHLPCIPESHHTNPIPTSTNASNATEPHHHTAVSDPSASSQLHHPFAPSSSSSSFKQAIKKFSRKRGGGDVMTTDDANSAAFTETLVPDRVLIPETRAAAGVPPPPACPRS
jgi:hypothetical protein